MPQSALRTMTPWRRMKRPRKTKENKREPDDGSVATDKSRHSMPIQNSAATGGRVFVTDASSRGQWGSLKENSWRVIFGTSPFALLSQKRRRQRRFSPPLSSRPGPLSRHSNFAMFLNSPPCQSYWPRGQLRHLIHIKCRH